MDLLDVDTRPPRAESHGSRLKLAAATVLFIGMVAIYAGDHSYRSWSYQATIFNRLGYEGRQHFNAERYDQAAESFHEQSLLAPDNPRPLYKLARSCAAIGEAERALDTLKRAADRGFVELDRLEADPHFAAFRGSKEYSGILATIRKTLADRAKERTRGIYVELPHSEARLFRSVSALERYFDREERLLAASRYQRYFLVQFDAEADLLNQRVASLNRLARETRSGHVREEAILAIARCMHRYRDPVPPLLWYEDGEAAFQAAEYFLSEFPESTHRQEVLFLRAVAAWFSRPDPSHTEPQVLDEWRGSVDDLFAEVLAAAPASVVAGKAMVWRVLLEFRNADSNVTPELLHRYRALSDRFSASEQVVTYANRYLRNVALKVRGLGEFVFEDIDGNSWDRKALAGRVVIIHFWATWCDPCIREIDHLRDLNARYTEAELQILGINLDTFDSGIFRDHVASLGVTWPQMFDGREFDSPHVRRYGVRGIPFTILLDHNGEVVLVNPDPEILRERVSVLVNAGVESSQQHPR